jgi:hypothetical protein
MPLRPNAFGKTGSELDRALGDTLREKRQSRIEEIEQELKGYYNRDGIFAINNPRVKSLMAELAKNKALRKISNGTGNSTLDWLTGVALIKGVVGDDARQQRRDIGRELDRNIKFLDNALGNPRFSGADLGKDLQVASDFYGSMFKGIRPPDLSNLSGRSKIEAARDYYKQLYERQQQQERQKIKNR